MKSKGIPAERSKPVHSEAFSEVSKDALHNTTGHYQRPSITNVAKAGAGNQNFNLRCNRFYNKLGNFFSVDYHSPSTEQYFSTPQGQTQVNISNASCGSLH